MSILAAWVRPRRATIVVDTLARTATGLIPCSKVHVIPHLNVAIGGRGSAQFNELIHAYTLREGFYSFDELLASLTRLIVSVEQATMMFPLPPVPGSAIGHELFFVGWSDRQSRMLGYSVVKHDDEGEWDCHEGDIFIAPWDAETMPASWADPFAIDTHDEVLVEKVASAQVRLMGHDHAGGTLVRCDVSRHSVSLAHGISL